MMASRSSPASGVAGRRELPRQPIGQDLADPILKAQAGLARGRFRGAAGLRVKVIEVRENGSSHGRACGGWRSDSAAAPRQRLSRRQVRSQSGVAQGVRESTGRRVSFRRAW